MAFISFDNPCSLLLIGALSLLTGIFLWKSRNHTRKKLPPCVPALPLVGSIPFLRLTGTNDHLRFQGLAQKYGNIYSFWMGKKFVVFISGYDLIRSALLDQPMVMAGRPFAEMYSFQVCNPKCLGLVIPSYTAPGWKKEKQVCMAILKDFDFGRSHMESKIKMEVQDLISHLVNLDEKTLDIRHVLEISVCNVISSMVLGHRYTFNDCEVLKAVLRALELAFALGSKVLIGDFVPLMFYLPALKKALRETVKLQLFVKDFIHRFIKEHEGEHVLGKEDDFIDAFIGRMGKEYSSERLLHIVLDLFIAGTETSSSTLQWAVIYIANNQDIQRKVQCEIDTVVGSERLVSMGDKPALPYTEATVLEVQRLATLVPLSVAHMNFTDTELCGYQIPAKSMVLFNLWSVLRDPCLWPEPDKFRPERHLDDHGGVVHRSELIPFSLGRRSCLGEVLARQELFLFFCGLVQNFNIMPPSDVEKLDEKGTTGMTRTPIPFQVILESRN